MTDATESDATEKGDGGRKGKLSLSRPGRLELNKTVGAGQVRQSFSHGRTKTVVVERRQKRTFKQAEDGAMSEVRDVPEAELLLVEKSAAAETVTPAAKTDAAALHTLTDKERAARLRALEDARHTEERIAESRAEREAMEARRLEEERLRRELDERRSREETERRRKEDAERRQFEEDERKRQEEAARKAAEQAARLEARTGVEAPSAKTREEAERAEPRRPSGRREDRRRRDRKLTISQALNDDERQRSLASLRRRREREKRAEAGARETVKIIREVVIPETITVQELANRMAERAGDVIKALMNNGVMATITQTIDADTAQLIVEEFGHTVKRVAAADVEIGLQGEADDEAALKPRPPVVTVMGHVDHGKTSLLDALRQTDVASGEAGGITQHIGAYRVGLADGGSITFLDTPGHEAFTEMRSRGANVTDIVVIVVAADDGVMPQTAEAISHAKAAGAELIVAINKIDRPGADPVRVRTDLLAHDVNVESLGGNVQDVEVSATEKTNLDRLQEAIALLAETLELRANPDREAGGVVIEASLDTGRGAVATVLVGRGTLRIGDIVVAGGKWGKVRALIDDSGGRTDVAGPSDPVEILGLDGAPDVGDDFSVVESEARAREITEYRQDRERDVKFQAGVRGTIDEIFRQIQKGEVKEVPVIVKGDVQGSIEAISQSLQKQGNEEVSVRVIHAGVGAVNESDVTLAKASSAMLVGFNVRANAPAKAMAARDGVDLLYFSVIYDLIDHMKQILTGMLAPQRRETFLGNAAIREVFNISRVGRVAGCEVTEGVVRRGARVRLLRDDTVVHEGRLSTLKRFKDEVREVTQGFECGMAFENYQDLRDGDVIECFTVEEIARTL